MKLLQDLILAAIGIVIAHLTSPQRLTMGGGAERSGTRPGKRKAKQGVNRSVLRRQAQSERQLAPVES